MRILIYMCPVCLSVFKRGIWRKLSQKDIDAMKSRSLDWLIYETKCVKCGEVKNDTTQIKKRRNRVPL